MSETKTGVEIIAAERQRQITEEGFTPENDDKYTSGELAQAAGTYILPPENRIKELAKAGALCAAEIDRLLRLEGKQ